MSKGNLRRKVGKPQPGRQVRASHEQTPICTSMAVNGPSSEEIATLTGMLSGNILGDAEIFAKALTERYPQHGLAWKVLGTRLRQRQRNDDALEPLRRAALLLPQDAELLNRLGNCLQDTGEPTEAIDFYRRALSLEPRDANIHNNLGNALRLCGRIDDAIAAFKKALAIDPNFHEAHCNLGNVFMDAGDAEAAASCYQNALNLNADFHEAHNNLGNALLALGRTGDAATSYERALSIQPCNAAALINLGNALHDQGRFDEAMQHYVQALKNTSDSAQAYINLGNTLKELGRLTDAGTCYTRALSLSPDSAEACSNLGNVLRDLGRPDEALAAYDRALALKPDLVEACSNRLFTLAHTGTTHPATYLSAARQWETRLVPSEVRETARLRRFAHLPRAGRRLKVAYVSGDFREHAVSHFIEPIFRLHDRQRIELFAYPTASRRDKVTERLQMLVEHWQPLYGLGDAAARDRIEADGIDVLIDLSGHTSGNRLGVFARRAAPVQMHYLGYFASTGLTEMDYLIADEILIPDEMSSDYSETIVRLPRIRMSYRGDDTLPVPDARNVKDDTVWLGSFNHLNKLTTETLVLWARILHELPEGKLLIKARGLDDPANRQRLNDTLAQLGIETDRYALRGGSADWKSHMVSHLEIDIALDPIGAHGGATTTCDALWMGLPVITRIGHAMPQRMTASMLTAIGRSEWIADSDERYLDKVIGLARDKDHRRHARLNQRLRMTTSALCDAQGLARALESCYEDVYDVKTCS